MSAATETVMTPTLPMEPAPAKVVKKRGPKKKTAKEADNTDKNTPIETDKKMTGEKKEKKEKKEKEEDSESQDTATKKTRAPTLSANNKRFVQFTYFLLNKLKDTHPEILIKSKTIIKKYLKDFPNFGYNGGGEVIQYIPIDERPKGLHHHLITCSFK